VFHLFAALADFERALVSERTRDRLAAARARGRVGGRPSVMSTDKLDAAQRMHVEGASVTTIARTLSVGRVTVYRHLDLTGDRSSVAYSQATPSPSRSRSDE